MRAHASTAANYAAASSIPLLQSLDGCLARAFGYIYIAAAAAAVVE